MGEDEPPTQQNSSPQQDQPNSPPPPPKQPTLDKVIVVGVVTIVVIFIVLAFIATEPNQANLVSRAVMSITIAMFLFPFLMRLLPIKFSNRRQQHLFLACTFFISLIATIQTENSQDDQQQVQGAQQQRQVNQSVQQQPQVNQQLAQPVDAWRIADIRQKLINSGELPGVTLDKAGCWLEVNGPHCINAMKCPNGDCTLLNPRIKDF